MGQSNLYIYPPGPRKSSPTYRDSLLSPSAPTRSVLLLDTFGAPVFFDSYSPEASAVTASGDPMFISVS
ncbi:hypothetical protein PG993_002283 [Apiospora rasikravindrae]|uniref:Uncharacterized protein n=1 Tax=Apiospora rasikravindrae TaxID=990691 RepID=A0ABR1TYV7_9PEZI